MRARARRRGTAAGRQGVGCHHNAAPHMQQVVVTSSSRTASIGHIIDGAVYTARAAWPLLGERVDDALNGARRPLVQQPMRRTSTYGHDGATRVRAPGALSHPARKRAWGSNLFLVLVEAVPTVEAIHARRLSRQQHGARPPPLPSPQLPSLPSLALVAAATHTVLASAVVLSLAGPCPWQADRRGRPSGCTCQPTNGNVVATASDGSGQPH